MLRTVAIVACLAVNLYLVAAKDVVHLTADDFDDYVDGSNNILVEFYAPWCGHCKNLAPEWQAAAETFEEGDDIIIAALDATQATAIASKYGVKGYPTLKYFPKGTTDPEDYNGGRVADQIVSWVNGKIGTDRKRKLPPSFVVDLTSENFDKQVLGEKGAMVEFYAPWCGHCKKLAPAYERVAKAFAAEPLALVAKVDCTEETELAERYGITGFPTLKFFPPGSADPIDYEGQREMDPIADFINEKSGGVVNHRNINGQLKLDWGKIDDLTKVIYAHTQAGNSIADPALKPLLAEKIETLTLTPKEQGWADLYLSFADKIVAKGEEYVEKEMERLTAMGKSEKMKLDKQTQFQFKRNILEAFQKPDRFEPDVQPEVLGSSEELV